jgi:hypothetical protein
MRHPGQGNVTPLHSGTTSRFSSPSRNNSSPVVPCTCATRDPTSGDVFSMCHFMHFHVWNKPEARGQIEVVAALGRHDLGVIEVGKAGSSGVRDCRIEGQCMFWIAVKPCHGSRSGSIPFQANSQFRSPPFGHITSGLRVLGLP